MLNNDTPYLKNDIHTVFQRETNPLKSRFFSFVLPLYQFNTMLSVTLHNAMSFFIATPNGLASLPHHLVPFTIKPPRWFLTLCQQVQTISNSIV